MVGQDSHKVLAGVRFPLLAPNGSLVKLDYHTTLRKLSSRFESGMAYQILSTKFSDVSLLIFIGMKTCSKCLQPKSLDEFTKKKSSKDGYSRICKECSRMVVRLSYQRNKKYYIDKAKRAPKKYESGLVE